MLVDLSAEHATGQEVPCSVLRVERAITRGLLEDASLNALPVLFWNELIYALDRKAVAAFFAGAPSTPACEPTRPVAPHAARRTMSAASVVGRRVLKLVPERARPDARQSLLHARNALVAVLRPPPSPLFSPNPTTAALEPGRLSTVVRPAEEHIIWTCGSCVGTAPLRQLAEAKLATSFRVASICYGLTGGSPEVCATRTIDLLDASDLVFCVSSDVQHDLARFALECGRPTPDSRLLPLSTDPNLEAAVAVVRTGLRTLARNERRTPT